MMMMGFNLKTAWLTRMKKKENNNCDLCSAGDNSANKPLYVEDFLTKLCPNQSCLMEYSVSEVNGDPTMCENCHQFICTRCDVMYHYGMTCEFYRTSLQSADNPKEKVIQVIFQEENEEMVVCNNKNEGTVNKEEKSEELRPHHASCSDNSSTTESRILIESFLRYRDGFSNEDGIGCWREMGKNEQDAFFSAYEQSVVEKGAKTSYPTDECSHVLSSEDSDEDDFGCWIEMEKKEHDAFYNAYEQSVVEKGEKTLCPTSKCSAMYKVGEANDDPFLCPECKFLICTSCQVFYHVGMTCELFLSILKGGDVPDDHGINIKHITEAINALNPSGLLKLPTWQFRNLSVCINRRRKDTSHCLRTLLMPFLSGKLEKIVENSRPPIITSNYSDSCKKKYCPTPDCCTEYEVNENMGITFTCPTCLKVICTRCNVIYHENMTCEAYQNSEENVDCSLRVYFNADPQNRRLCSCCSSPIEKVGGCNQVRCLVCDYCICWECGLSFFTSRNYESHVCK